MGKPRLLIGVGELPIKARMTSCVKESKKHKQCIAAYFFVLTTRVENKDTDKRNLFIKFTHPDATYPCAFDFKEHLNRLPRNNSTIPWFGGLLCPEDLS